ncbi:MAG: siderophore-interacting protein, partial [Alcaligenaceae bacterium]|nr:siderophore-interacting protein [Alcaligenaceae bacterium]
QSCNIPADDSRFVWVGAEFATAQSVRAWLRHTVGLGNKEQLVVAYWRHGMNETQMKKMPAKLASSKTEGQEAGS